MKKINIGGQAVIEGVMMKYENKYAVAVRKADQDIVIDKKEINTLSSRKNILKQPIIRGMVAFIESMIIGIKTLTYSAEFFEGDSVTEPSKFDKIIEKIFKDKTDDVLIAFSIFIAIFFGIGLFMIAPLLITRIFKSIISELWIQNLIEGVIRITLFLTYILLISKLKDIQRVFEYHGAEHKTIHCLENEEKLTVENVKKYPRLHKRCGTNFLLIVMIVSILIFMFVKTDVLMLRLLSRIILVPIIAGLSYEIIRFAGKSDSAFVNIISYPGLCLQKLTTREPDDSQIEVAIAAVNEVLSDGDNPRETVL